MKKIGIAVFALMFAGIAYVGAQEVEIDFDGKSLRSTNFIETAKMSGDFQDDKNFEIILPALKKCSKPLFGTTESRKQNDTILYQLGKNNRKKLILKVENTLIDSEVLALINDEKIDILWDSNTVLFVDTVEATKYIILLKSSDVQLIRFLQAPTSLKASALICKVVEIALMELVKGVWTKVIKQVEQCYSEDTSGGETGGSGSTYHNGQGGSSNYDVNKYLK